MRSSDFDADTIRLMEESDNLPDIVGPATYTEIAVWESNVKFFSDEALYKPWISRHFDIACDRAREKYSRFKTEYLQDCDPSYNTNDNYDPPENVWDCTRTTDTLEGDWYEHHNCPKYMNQQRDYTTLG